MTTISRLYPLLKKAGLSESEASEFVEVMDESLTKNLATKEDLKETKLRLIKWVIVLLFAPASIIIAIIKLF